MTRLYDVTHLCLCLADAKFKTMDMNTSEAREQRFSMARSLIQCGLVQQGDMTRPYV